MRAMGLGQTPEQLGEYIVATTPRGPVRLRDVARVEVGYKRQTSRVRYSTHEQPGSQQAIPPAPGRALHHARIRRLGAEPQRRHHVGAQIDRQDLHHREGERHPRERERQIRHQLGDVRRQDVGEEPADVLEDGAALFDGVDDAGDVRVVELEGHPFFVATLFQPERSALKAEVHPLIAAYLQAVLSRNEIRD